MCNPQCRMSPQSRDSRQRAPLVASGLMLSSCSRSVNRVIFPPLMPSDTARGRSTNMVND